LGRILLCLNWGHKQFNFFQKHLNQVLSIYYFYFLSAFRSPHLRCGCRLLRRLYGSRTCKRREAPQTNLVGESPNIHYSSRKHGTREPQSFSHCGSLTTLIYNHWTNANFFSWFTSWHFKNLGAFNIPLERSWKYLSNNVVHAPRISKLQSYNQKNQFAII
jgi:hypothetical protein